MIRSIKGYDVYLYKNGKSVFYGFVPGLNEKSRKLVQSTMNLKDYLVLVSEESVVRYRHPVEDVAVKLYPCKRPADVVGCGMYQFTGEPY